MSFGLESTRVLPNASSSFTVLEIDPPTAALGLLYWTEKNDVLSVFGVVASDGPTKFWRNE
jgi:hypothetical protein